MAYSVMVWLVNPGEYPQQEEEQERATAGRDRASGAATGSNIGYGPPRMVYGVYESPDEAENAPAPDLHQPATERPTQDLGPVEPGLAHPREPGSLRGLRRSRTSQRLTQPARSKPGPFAPPGIMELLF